MTDPTLTDRIKNVDGKNLGISLVFAFIPALVLALELAWTVRQGSPVMFWLPLVGFTYLLYHQHPIRNKGGSVLYYLSIEAFLLPVATLSSMFIFTGGQSGLEQVGAAIASGIVLIAAAIIGFGGGIALYLISKRVIIESPSETGASG